MEKRERKSDPPTIVKELGSRLLELIREKGLKIREIAHSADLDVENLRKYIKGTQEMKISTLVRIANALDVPIHELFSFYGKK